MPHRQDRYVGSKKHKNRPASGKKGSLCPEWMHETPDGGFEIDPNRHNWPATQAHQLFMTSAPDPEGARRRFATARGIAFVALPTNDGTWHGYPIPWKIVPSSLVEEWLANRSVTGRDVKRYSEFDDRDLKWALESDKS